MSRGQDWLDRVPLPNPELAWRLVDDECIIVDPQTSQATVLNPVGARIWDLMDGKRTLAAILDQVVSEYAVARERVEADAIEFVQDLSTRKLLTWQDESAA